MLSEIHVTAEMLRQTATGSVKGSGDSWSSSVDCGFCLHRQMYWCADGRQIAGGYELAKLKIVAHTLDQHAGQVVLQARRQIEQGWTLGRLASV